MERISVQREDDGDGAAALATLVAAARSFSSGTGLTERQTQRLCITVEEVAANALDHGEAQRASLALEAMGGAVRIVFRDDGTPFDPRSYVPLAQPDTETGGGAGIAMILAWCEIIEYRSGPEGNELDLVLRIR